MMTGRTVLASRAPPIAAALPAKNVLASVELLCRVAQRVAVTPPSHNRELLSSFYGKMIRWKSHGEEVDRNLMMALVLSISRTLASAFYQLRDGDSRRRVMDVLRKVGAEEMERVRKDLASGAQQPSDSNNSRNRPQQLPERSVRYLLHSMMSKVLGLLPMLLQQVWDGAAGGGRGGGGGSSGHVEGGRNNGDGKGMAEEGLILQRNGKKELSVRHQLAKLLLDVDHGGCRQLAADGNDALSYIVTMIAALGRLSWVSTMAFGSSLVAEEGAADFGEIAAAVTSMLQRNVGGDIDPEPGLSPVVLHLRSEEAGQRQPQGEQLADGNGGALETSASAASTAGNGGDARSAINSSSSSTAPSLVHVNLRLGRPWLWARCAHLHRMEGTRVGVSNDDDYDDGEFTLASHRQLVRRLLQKLDERHSAILEPSKTGDRGLRVATAALLEVHKALLEQGRDFIIVPILRSSQLKQELMEVMSWFETRLHSAMLAEVAAGHSDDDEDGGDGRGGDPATAAATARVASGSGGTLPRSGRAPAVRDVLNHPAFGCGPSSSRTTAKTPNACGSRSSSPADCNPAGGSSSSSSSSSHNTPYNSSSSAALPSTSISTSSVAPAAATRAAMEIRSDWRQRRELVINWALCCLLGLTRCDEIDHRCVQFGMMEFVSMKYPEDMLRMLIDDRFSGTFDVYRMLCERVTLLVLECRKGQPDAVVLV
ncbi:hypothetical protein Vretifemale_19262 [Volvox reticuliferus]|nr:hypothetical protein Vretifemale_19262 [Volvox reticuliferus]